MMFSVITTREEIEKTLIYFLRESFNHVDIVNKFLLSVIVHRYLTTQALFANTALRVGWETTLCLEFTSGFLVCPTYVSRPCSLLHEWSLSLSHD